ncbi:MAG TPA: metalloregulator ArsR/SmtB family transcription factor [Streptosporangiaceae bacterium]|nr:metalloregulator ArsR/SmtB family transcription factor [Streptosporangiaceae bacterium]
MNGTAHDLDGALRALADVNRRTILALVRERARPVGEIAEQVAMSQQAVSHHLRVLRGAGLVTERREGARHLFQVRTDGLQVVREFLDGFWPTQLAALKRAAEAESQRGAVGGGQNG